ncbi:MAG: plasmid pRiA4b ORF-3 family protein [Desulfobulbaceae bacterium]|nr:plasmid pRiA4b ORF-3 family protein [Desulfobulbaceae bacterium]
MGKIIKVDFPQKNKKIKQILPDVYQLKISLLGTDPVVWRRVQVPGSFSLAKLHDVIQLSMGWDDSHMHQFIIGKELYGRPSEEEDWEGTKVFDERKTRLSDLKAKIKKKFIYEYDFGDSWQHEIKVEKVIAAKETILKHPILLAGERACPPEDVGGIPGYEEFLAALKNPEDEENAEILDWYGEEYDPDHVGLEEINKLLKKLR